MPSPFPGMDPYLEAPDVWPDFHNALAGEIRAILNGTLPPRYYARLEMRPEIGIVEEQGRVARRIVPDVAVARLPGPGGVAVLETPRVTISPSVEVSLLSEPIQHAFVEIRDPSRGHHLITLIEIASPANKRPGPDRQAYLRKQQEVLGSDANLIEIDLLRTGERLLSHPELEAIISGMDPRPDYLVTVNRAWKRAGGGMTLQIFPIPLADVLPCIFVPLRETEAEVPLDLQYVMNRAYGGGPYRRGLLDYCNDPDPPLAEPQRDWARKTIDELARRASEGPSA